LKKNLRSKLRRIQPKEIKEEGSSIKTKGVSDPDDSSCVDVGELFAVSTEMFYESPSEFHRMAPEIYDCLMKLYRFNTMVEIPKKQKITNIKDTLSMLLNRLK